MSKVTPRIPTGRPLASLITDDRAITQRTRPSLVSQRNSFSPAWPDANVSAAFRAARSRSSSSTQWSQKLGCEVHSSGE